MTFSIELFPDKIVDPQSGGLAQEGEITLGSFQERFVSLVGYWGPRRYSAHWREALTRIVQGATTSCLVTSIADPAHSHLLFWWPLYRTDDLVRVQNAILFFEQLSSPFDPSDPFRFVPERRTESEEGMPISEWDVSISDIIRFLHTPVRLS